MATTKSQKRGRPKGTGLNDQHHLEKIAALLFKQEGLKPTTAIKSLGITDPSAIRRLRDKFNRARDQLMKQAEGITIGKHVEIPVLVSQAPAPTPTTIAASTCALATRADPKLSENSRRISKKKTVKTSKQKTKNQVLKKQRTTAAKTKRAKTKPTPTIKVETTAINPCTLDLNSLLDLHANLTSSWFSLTALILQTATTAQLQAFSTVHNFATNAEANRLQNQAMNTWLSGLGVPLPFFDPFTPNTNPNAS